MEEGEGHQRGHEGEVGLEEPGRIGEGQLGGDRERDEGAYGVAGGEVDLDGGLVARGCEALEGAAVFEDVVGEGEPGRDVVELDVADEGGVTGEDYRQAEDDQDTDRGEPGPRPVPSPAPPGIGEEEAGQREGQDERGGETGERRRERGQTADRDQGPEAERDAEGQWETTAGDRLDQQAEPGREEAEDEREDDPGDDQGTGTIAPLLANASAFSGSGW